MKNLKNNKSLAMLTLVAVVLISILFIFTFVLNPTRGLFGNSDLEVDTETLEQDYSRLNQLTPGVSTTENVEEINGEPYKTEEKNGKTYLYYPTPFEDDGNIVVISNETVEYVYEYVFGDYRGTLEEYVNQYGNPSFEATSNISEYDTWFVFLADGIMVMASGNKVDSIIYFIPQDQASFLNSELSKNFNIQPIIEGANTDSAENFGPPGAGFEE